MRAIGPLFVALAVCMPRVPAQAADEPRSGPDLQAQAAAMAKLSFLLGDWHGEGWIAGAKGRTEFRQTETIRLLQEGTLISIEGRGYVRSAPPDAKPSFAANALVSYDDATKEYRFYSFAQGRSGTFKAELMGPDTLRWYPEPVRFTIRIESDGQWREIGEAPDGKGGFRGFFEMKLQRSH